MDEGAGPEGDGIVGATYLQHMLPFLREAVYVFDRNGELKARLSPPGGMLGYDAELGSNVFAHIHPDDVPRGIRIGAEAHEAQADWMGEVPVRLRHADGTWRHFELRLWNRYDDPAIDGMVGVLRALDTEPGGGVAHDAAEDAAFVDELATAYLALGHQGRIRFASEPATRLLAAAREDLVGLPIGDLVVDRDRPAVVAAYAALLEAPGTRTVLATTRTRFGGRVVAAELHTRGTDQEHKVVTVQLVDQDQEPELVRLATRDPLTGLANRTRVMETLAGLLHEERHEPHLAVVYVDLDDLKGINDHHGHETGDRALIEVGNRLNELVREGDLVGRMSGDEFVVVCPGLDGRGLVQLVDRLGDEAATTLRVPTPDDGMLTLPVSAGGATAVAGDTPATLLRRADEAMFEAKHRRG
ncbi:MAG: diguanylate cyclase [Acidimicrobiales bacterium]